MADLPHAGARFQMAAALNAGQFSGPLLPDQPQLPSAVAVLDLNAAIPTLVISR
jgi:hypothetical protein